LRLSSFRIVVAISCLLFAIAAWRIGPHTAAQAQTPASAQPAVSSSSSHQHAKLQNASVTSAKPATIPELRLIAPPGSEIYTAKRGEAIPTIAHRYLSRTSYLTSSELAAAIRAANHKSDSATFLKANENVIIPGILAAPVVEKTISIPKDFEVRAVYLTGIMAGSDHGLRIIRQWRSVGGNSVVFDIKDSDGSVSVPFEHPLVGKHTVYIHDLAKLVRFIHQQNMHAIARIAIFRDERLVTEHPELAVQSRRNHTAWRENGKLVWTDPSQPKVQDYNIALAKYAAQLGVDEIQFDYVRFPAEGDQKDAQFVFQGQQPEPAEQPDSCKDESANAGTDAAKAQPTANVGAEPLLRPAPLSEAKGSVPSADATTTASADPTAGSDAAPAPKGQKNAVQGASAPQRVNSSRGTAAKNGNKSRKDATNAACHAPRGPQRSDVIAAFLKKAYAEIHPTGALFSLDVFGVMAWQRPVDLSHTGQDIVQMARYCDILSPMIYPSHFFGMDKIPHPGDEPAHFIAESMDRFELITKGSGVVIRPWLQAFHWRTKTYSPEYIKIQVETARAKGGIGFLFWNAGNDYSKPFIAMPEMKAANYKPASIPDAANQAGSRQAGLNQDAANQDGSNQDGQNKDGSNKEGPSKDGAASGANSKDGSNPGPRFFRGDELPVTNVQASLTPTN
jgi:hypothetical protein